MTRDEYIEYVNKLNKYNHAYHVLNQSLIPDEEYDKLYRGLVDIESRYPEYITSASPTQRVGGKVLDGFVKVTRDKPMLSLDNVFNYDELNGWVISRKEKLYPFLVDYGLSDVNSYLDNLKFTVEPKLDGLAISLIYADGKFSRAITRGDGITGEDVTETVKTVQYFPFTLMDNLDFNEQKWGKITYLEVRGEIYMNKSDFNHVNTKLLESGEQPLKHPRNAAAGAIRNLDTSVTASRRLSFSAYTLFDIVFEDDRLNKIWKRSMQSHFLRLGFLKALGFRIQDTDFRPKRVTSDKIVEVIDSYQNLRAMADTPIDGAVVKVDTIYHQDELGENKHSPEWAIAYKYPPQQVVTKLLGITYQVGRTGVITPVGEIKPVLIDGVEVSRVTFHNPTFLANCDVGMGDDISIIRSGDVIPKFQSVVKSNSEYKIGVINRCPCCHTELITENLEKDGKVTRCPNRTDCLEQKIQTFIYFVSRNVMNIMYLGEEYIRFFVTEGILNTPADIFSLDDAKLRLHPAIKDGESKRLLESIETARRTTYRRFITALSIPTIGYAKAAKLIPFLKSLQSVDELTHPETQVTIEKLIGVVSTTELINWFQVTGNFEYYQLLKSKLIFEDDAMVIPDNLLKHKRVVVTGSISDVDRLALQEMLEKLGAINSGSVTTKTDYLILGEKPGSKYKKAQDLNIPILTESDFLKIIEVL